MEIKAIARPPLSNGGRELWGRTDVIKYSLVFSYISLEGEVELSI